MLNHETIFGLDTTQLKFGRNSLYELGWELSKYNSTKISDKIINPSPIFPHFLTTFFTTTAVKRLVVDLLRTICKQTTNTLDDKAVDILEKQLFPDK